MSKKPWIDLAEDCLDFKLAYTCPDERGCWLCEHFIFDKREECEIAEHEKERKLRVASKYEGQLTLER